MESKSNVIYSYSRKQAIEDGVLIDITSEAKEIGFKIHTVVTSNLFYRYIVPKDNIAAEGQSTTGRLHDLIVLALFAAKSSMNTDQVKFPVSFLMDDDKKETVEVIAHIGPGDRGEPVLTLMLVEDL